MLVIAIWGGLKEEWTSLRFWAALGCVEADFHHMGSKVGSWGIRRFGVTITRNGPAARTLSALQNLTHSFSANQCDYPAIIFSFNSGVGRLLFVISFSLVSPLLYNILKYCPAINLMHPQLIFKSCLHCLLDQKDLRQSLVLTKATCSVRATIKECKAGRLHTGFISPSK